MNARRECRVMWLTEKEEEKKKKRPKKRPKKKKERMTMADGELQQEGRVGDDDEDG